MPLLHCCCPHVPHTHPTQGYVPTLMEDVPDMAVKFAVYETMRLTHASLHNNRQPSTLEDLVMGGAAGAAAAAATTPLDVIKTRMMCTASSRPTLVTAARSVLAEGDGLRAFFRGVGPRALSNGINSAVFFCFFEAIRRVSEGPCSGSSSRPVPAGMSCRHQDTVCAHYSSG